MEGKEFRNLGYAGASAQSGDYVEKSRHIFRIDRSGAAQQKKELGRDLAHQHQGDRPEHSGDHRSRCPRIEPAAKQHEQKQATDQQKRQQRAPKWPRRSRFLTVSAQDGASRPSGFGRARSEHWLLAEPLSRLANPRSRLFQTCVASPCPTLSCCSSRMSLRFSQVRSHPRLGHRGGVAGRKEFVERLIEVRILIGLPRFGIDFLVHGNLSRSPFRNQLRIAVGGQNYPTIPTINKSAP